MNLISEKNLCSLDSKGRLLLPLQIRERLKIRKGETLVLVSNISESPFLELRTTKQWEAFLDKIMATVASEEKKEVMRYASGSREVVTVDGQGRILVPQRFREACHLDGTVAVLNMTTYVEIWNLAYIQKRHANMMRAYHELSNKVY